MARLKVKQIEGFSDAVQNLIDANDVLDQAQFDALTASVDSLEGATGAATGDLEASVDSLEDVDAGLADDIQTVSDDLQDFALGANASIDSLEGVDTVLSDAIEAEGSRAKAVEGFLANSVDSLEVALGDEETARINEDSRLEGLINANSGAIGDNDADIAELVASVDSIEVVDGQQNESIDSLETAISNILDIPGTDLDQFSEMVTFVKSVDTVNDGLLSDFIGVANASVDSLEVVASTAIDERGDIVASIDSLELATGGNTSALEASVDSLEDVDAGLADDIQAVGNDLQDYVTATDASIDSLEDVDAALSAEIATNASDIGDNGAAIGDLQASVDSLETAEDNAIASIDSLETVTIGLATDDLRLHQFGSFVSPTSFTVALAVDVTPTADTLVFINGHNIHVETEGLDGWSSPDGLTFNLAGIGYNIDAEDHIYVVAPRG